MIIIDDERCVFGVGDGGATVKIGISGGACINKEGGSECSVCVNALTALKAASAPAMRVFHEVHPLVTPVTDNASAMYKLSKYFTRDLIVIFS